MPASPTLRALTAAMRPLATAVAATAILLTLPACGGKTVKVESADSTTVGQELQDLDKAYRDGIITKSEYEKSKKRILEGKR